MERRQFLTVGSALAASLTFLPTNASAQGHNLPEPRNDRRAAVWFNANRRFANLTSGRIAYVERGSGAVALFLHGFPLSGFQWRGALKRLAGFRRCIAPDFLGLGFTEVANGHGVAPTDQAKMLAEFLDHFSVRTVDLVANDSGGAVAQLFAVRYPNRVRTMLLTNCDVETDSPPAALLPVIDMARAGTYPDKWLVPWVKDKALARSPDGLGGMCYSDPSQPTDAAIEMYLAPLVASQQRKALTNAYTLGLTPNPLAGIEPKLRVLSVPTRIIWGARDTIFSPNNPGYLDRLLRGSQGVRYVADGKLFFPEEYPDLVAEEARRLWSHCPNKCTV